ncbi:MAG: autotransporter outer membrane beta-barrel domain-containing protein [Bacteroidales bacterium]|nr:autotransporter outer membrane beta-barrel domain-containing protein [Bacteroidales bacterium]
MKKLLLLVVFFTIFYAKSYAQIIFENGYFINEADEKIVCLIKNIDWRNNPTEFEYMIPPNQTVQRATIETVKEFGIDNVSKYIRAKTKMDRSSDHVSAMSAERKPIFNEEILFLKVLIEGKASLFTYVNGNLIRFFFNYDDSEIEQLVYKRYLIENKIDRNDYYKHQLLINLECEGLGLKEVEHLNYTKRDLEKLFIKYNECTGSDYLSYKTIQKKDLFNLTLKPGFKYSSLDIKNAIDDSKDTDFGNMMGFRFGIEAELILPFNKNKWSIIIEPTYQYFKSEQSKETSSFIGGILVSKVDYKSIELPIGVRHYFHLNNKSKLYANISYVIDFPSNSSIKFLRSDDTEISQEEISTGKSLALGIGYKYKETYSLEIRYYTKREVMKDHQFWNSNYNSLSIILGFTLF